MYAEFNLLIIVCFVGLAAGFSKMLPKGNKWIALLLASIAFYALLYSWQTLWLLAMALITYIGARQIRKIPGSVVYLVPLLLLPLVLEKATHLTPHYIMGSQGVNPNAATNIALIIGLSYFTFNAISYLVDVKRRYIEPERSFPRLLFYLLFFPALLSGPLHRYKFINNQLNDIGWSLQSLSNGSVLLLWGFFKNMVVAQRLQYMLNGTEATGWFVLVQGLLFFLFLYVNFSSFIDIVQGIALLFNLQLKSNFHNRVYMACSRQQFWQGWHITLNEWFRDYFFFSVARFDKQRRYTNLLLLLTFLLIALWHGFTLVLLVWGLLNGCWIITEKKWMGKWQPVTWWQKTAGRLYHLGLASVLAALFITPSLGSLFTRFIDHGHLSLAKGGGYVLMVLVIAFVGMDWLNAKAADKRMDLYLQTLPYWQRTTLCGALLVAVFLFGLTNSITNYYIRF
jgi:alginate O-acetyltransferase complex protein AlgI